MLGMRGNIEDIPYDKMMTSVKLEKGFSHLQF